MTKENGVKVLTDMVADFVAHIGKKLPDDVVNKLEELGSQEPAITVAITTALGSAPRLFARDTAIGIISAVVAVFDMKFVSTQVTKKSPEEEGSDSDLLQEVLRSYLRSALRLRLYPALLQVSENRRKGIQLSGQ